MVCVEPLSLVIVDFDSFRSALLILWIYVKMLRVTLRKVSSVSSVVPITAGGEGHINQSRTYSTEIYQTMPIVLSRGEGCYVWDTAGNKYLDFVSGFGAVDQGHCHPKITAALAKQAKELTLTSRAFHSSKFAEAIEFVHNFFGYDKCIFMNTGCEAVETSVKLARRWAYMAKGIPED
jgi:ornithine--oxo-acid transaminase